MIIASGLPMAVNRLFVCPNDLLWAALVVDGVALVCLHSADSSALETP
jgi:hypothetical protein